MFVCLFKKKKKNQDGYFLELSFVRFVDLWHSSRDNNSCENWIWREAIVLNQHDKNEEVNIEFNERRWTMASGDQQMTIMVSVSV